MPFHSELRDAVESGRNDVVRVLAEHRVLPVEVEESEVETASLLGGSGGNTRNVELERQAEDADTSGHLVDRQTRTLVLDALGIDTADDCAGVQEEIRSHSGWGETA